MTEQELSVSIVINTYNRAKYLDDAIRSLNGLDYSNFEVVVVNGPSTDGTEEVIRSWGDSIKSATCAEANLSISRNIGIAAASGDIVCFIDDDARPHPRWLSNLVRVYSDPRIGAVGGFTIDNTGTRWQVRKTVCDRYGNAHNVGRHFDERCLNRPGIGYFPSLLGTNSSFRSTALHAVGGFDDVFAYLLDETDLCLRIVDAGWRIHYEPEAIVFHQFAESHIRSQEKIARTLYPSARSKSYFIMSHGMRHDPQRAGLELNRFRDEIARSNAWLAEHGKISALHRYSLDEDLAHGIEEGVKLAALKSASPGGDLEAREVAPPFLPFPQAQGVMRIAFVSRGFPPSNDTGIARWTRMLAMGMAAKGHHVHVITESRDGSETVSFCDGFWMHELAVDDAAAPAIAERYDIPHTLAAWCARVLQEIRILKGFGLEVASFPIWDLEGLPLLDEDGITTVVSLHTTYAMAKPYKPEWNIRPLLEHDHVNRVIAAEARVFERAPHFLANSAAIIEEIQSVYGAAIADRALLAPHGTDDPLVGGAATVNERHTSRARLQVLFVGRFELRKGFDLAVKIAHGLLKEAEIHFTFVGDELGAAERALVDSLGASAILSHPNVRFAGLVSRSELNELLIASDVVIMPSRFESFGLVAIESMAAGSPVLALRSGGLAEIVDADSGGVAFEDGAHVAGRFIDEIIALGSDRNALADRSQKARRAYERHFSADAMVAGAEEAYKKMHVSGLSKLEMRVD